MHVRSPFRLRPDRFLSAWLILALLVPSPALALRPHADRAGLEAVLSGSRAGAEETLVQAIAAKSAITREDVEQLNASVIGPDDPPGYFPEGQGKVEALVHWLGTRGADRADPLQHQGALGTWLRMAAQWGIDLDDPVVRAALTHWLLTTTMVPFRSGNHRIGWALMNVLLLHAGVLQHPLVLQDRDQWAYFKTFDARDDHEVADARPLIELVQRLVAHAGQEMLTTEELLADTGTTFRQVVKAMQAHERAHPRSYGSDMLPALIPLLDLRTRTFSTKDQRAYAEQLSRMSLEALRQEGQRYEDWKEGLTEPLRAICTELPDSPPYYAIAHYIRAVQFPVARGILGEPGRDAATYAKMAEVVRQGERRWAFQCEVFYRWDTQPKPRSHTLFAAAGLEERRVNVNTVNEGDLIRHIKERVLPPGVEGRDSLALRMATAIVSARDTLGRFQDASDFSARLYGTVQGVKNLMWDSLAPTFTYGRMTRGQLLGWGLTAALGVTVIGWEAYQWATAPPGRVVWLFDYHSPHQMDTVIETLDELSKTYREIYVVREHAPDLVDLDKVHPGLAQQITGPDVLDGPKVHAALHQALQEFWRLPGRLEERLQQEGITATEDSILRYVATHPKVHARYEQAPLGAIKAHLRERCAMDQAGQVLYGARDEAAATRLMTTWFVEGCRSDDLRDQAFANLVQQLIADHPGTAIVISRGSSHRGVADRIHYGAFQSSIPALTTDSPSYLVEVLTPHREALLHGEPLTPSRTIRHAILSHFPWAAVGSSLASGGDMSVQETRQRARQVIEGLNEMALAQLTHDLQTYAALLNQSAGDTTNKDWLNRFTMLTIAWLQDHGAIPPALVQQLPPSQRGLRFSQAIKLLRQTQAGLEEPVPQMTLPFGQQVTVAIAPGHEVTIKPVGDAKIANSGTENGRVFFLASPHLNTAFIREMLLDRVAGKGPAEFAQFLRERLDGARNSLQGAGLAINMIPGLRVLLIPAESLDALLQPGASLTADRVREIATVITVVDRYSTTADDHEGRMVFTLTTPGRQTTWSLGDEVIEPNRDLGDGDQLVPAGLEEMAADHTTRAARAEAFIEQLVDAGDLIWEQRKDDRTGDPAFVPPRPRLLSAEEAQLLAGDHYSTGGVIVPLDPYWARVGSGYSAIWAQESLDAEKHVSPEVKIGVAWYPLSDDPSEAILDELVQAESSPTGNDVALFDRSRVSPAELRQPLRDAGFKTPPRILLLHQEDLSALTRPVLNYLMTHGTSEPTEQASLGVEAPEPVEMTFVAIVHDAMGHRYGVATWA